MDQMARGAGGQLMILYPGIQYIAIQKYNVES